VATDTRKEAKVAKDEVEKARHEAEKVRHEAEKARHDTEQAHKTGKKPPMIPKPTATEMAEGTDRLRRAMGLTDDKATYLAIQVSTINSQGNLMSLTGRGAVYHPGPRSLGSSQPGSRISSTVNKRPW
jgi:hypothetical protein